MSEQLKECCATLYESDFARMLLGDSFHPGGQRLTRRLGEKLSLRSGLRVLDVASGKGESAIFLAQCFGTAVVGIDFGPENVKQAAVRADEAGVGHCVHFRRGAADKLQFPNAGFDAVISVYAIC